MRCPFADWEPASSDGGSYVGAPWRILLHTTEISSTASSDAELHRHYASHFISGSDRIIQLIDTDVAAMSLQHLSDPQTNRANCIQIEQVGYAEHRKDPAMLANTRKLCAWLVQQYNIPLVWPNGPSHPAINGRDPGNHNRSVAGWAKGGFFCHEHAPENFHWDSAFEPDEGLYVSLLTDALGPNAPPRPSTYTVVAGDSLWKVSTKFGLTLNALEKLNGIDPVAAEQQKSLTILKVGQTLKVAA